MKGRKHVHGLANEMLIKCWFSVYRNVRGKERNFLFSGKYCVFCIPRKKSGDQKVKVWSLVLIWIQSVKLIVFESSPRLTAHCLKSCQKGFYSKNPSCVVSRNYNWNFHANQSHFRT